MAAKRFYKSLYLQVLTAVVIGVLLGHFYPQTVWNAVDATTGLIQVIMLDRKTLEPRGNYTFDCCGDGLEADGVIDGFLALDGRTGALLCANLPLLE